MLRGVFGFDAHGGLRDAFVEGIDQLITEIAEGRVFGVCGLVAYLHP